LKCDRETLENDSGHINGAQDGTSVCSLVVLVIQT